MKLLLLSNSTNYGEPYMQWCAKKIAEFVSGNTERILFIPYAAVGFSYDEYTSKVNFALENHNVSVSGIHSFENPDEAIASATAIFVGGGNTFALTKTLQDLGAMSAIADRVEGGLPYVGWSAGSNIAGPMLCTTNDMPIVEPDSFECLGLVPFQINPHFTNKTIPNHGGETRKQRLNEYLAANPKSRVICLPEATYLEQKGKEISYIGNEDGLIMDASGERTIASGTNIS